MPPLVQHQNFWVSPELFESMQLVKDEFVPWDDDIILATFPKCGTTWLKALAFAITNRSHHTLAHHPLLTLHPQDTVPFLELPNRRIQPLAELEAIPSPRLLATHLPFSLLPASVTAVGSRFVYVYRDPKDVFVSKWHFENRMSEKLFIELGLSFHLFCEGFTGRRGGGAVGERKAAAHAAAGIDAGGIAAVTREGKGRVTQGSACHGIMAGQSHGEGKEEAWATGAGANWIRGEEEKEKGREARATATATGAGGSGVVAGREREEREEEERKVGRAQAARFTARSGGRKEGAGDVRR
ncbi:hypothetical protein C2845_PM05G23730 [Panicum miliaceum]|uniref:Sulfotransferase n=1 Tax=Panicum miliaceum TaxID=4540 RepID=A0A3L6SY75_PANMI|nr:hypothetical protein C2845_PM05G23730 [Panicum miliaceum]